MALIITSTIMAKEKRRRERREITIVSPGCVSFSTAPPANRSDQRPAGQPAAAQAGHQLVAHHIYTGFCRVRNPALSGSQHSRPLIQLRTGNGCCSARKAPRWLATGSHESNKAANQQCRKPVLGKDGAPAGDECAGRWESQFCTQSACCQAMP